jgi:hypothetical protein
VIISLVRNYVVTEEINIFVLPNLSPKTEILDIFEISKLV